LNFFSRKRDAPVGAADPPRMLRGLFLKYVAFFVTVVFVALFTNGVFELQFSVRDYTGFSIRVQRAHAEGAAAKISQFVTELESQLGWTTQVPWRVNTLDEWRYDMARLLRQVPAITEIARVDADGREQFRVSRIAPAVVGSLIDVSQEPKFREAVANKVYYGPVYFLRESEPYMTLASAGGGDTGVSIAEVNLKFIRDVVTQIEVGKRGYAYLVDAQGRLIAHPDLSLVLRNTDSLRLRQVQAARAGAPPVPPDEESVVENFQGRQVLAAYAPVGPLGWLVFVELPVEEAFAPLEAAIHRSVWLFLAALILASLAGLFLARRMVVPIRALRLGAARIGHGDFRQRISLKTRDELEALANQFNDMAGQLQESHADLENKVTVRTSELTLANQRLSEQWERLQRVDAFKNEILGKVAHDLKNPMAVIMGRAELLTELMAMAPLQRDKVDLQVKQIREAGQRLIDMINSLLADAMADALDISIRRVPLDLANLVEEVVEGSRPLLDKKEQRIVVSAGEPLLVTGDHDRLHEAIDNLLSNAIKYSPTGGKIEITLAREGHEVFLRIHDSGPGLTADDMSRLFGRFQRLSAKPTGGESSTGLGLSIVKRIVELHGGRISADSLGPGRGSVFTIALPVQPDAPSVA
jgi:two-component system, NtrC family, sensor kinase